MHVKHFVNDPEALVTAALHSLTITNPNLLLDEQSRIVYRGDVPAEAQKVAIFSGGGSGHEPGFAGYVGKGFLTASIAGSIFASPAATQIKAAFFDHVSVSQGALVLVMNYTGDVLNFGIAAETARAAGIEVEFLVIGDDVSVGRKKGGKVGRRGIAGSVLVAKIAGALAETGSSLSDVYHVAKLTADNIASIGSSLSHCHVPGRMAYEDPGLKENNNVEVGMGIHNEPGTCRVEATLPELVRTMLSQILDTKDEDRHFINIVSSDEIVVFLNNLGGVSVLEMGAITAEVCVQLEQTYGINPKRVIAGSFLTSLNGLGWSVTLLKLQDTGLGPGKTMMELLDAPTEAVGWSGPTAVTAGTKKASCVRGQASGRIQNITEDKQSVTFLLKEDLAIRVLKAGLESAIAAEPEVTEYDTILGDGDCGVNMKRTAERILKTLPLPEGRLVSASSFMQTVAQVVDVTMEGTSGAIYGIFLHAFIAYLRRQATQEPDLMSTNTWAVGLSESLGALQKYTTAERGNRTLMDALIPFIETFAATKSVKKAANASRAGTDGTKAMQATLGRAVYVGGEEEWIGKVPDPGAYGLAAFFDGLACGLDEI